MNRRTFLKTTAAGISGLGLAGLGAGRITPIHAAQGTLQAGLQAVVTADELNLRGGPGADEPRVATLSEGALVDLLARSGSGAWWRVVAGASVGWVSGQYVEPTGASASSDAF